MSSPAQNFFDQRLHITLSQGALIDPGGKVAVGAARTAEGNVNVDSS